MSVHLDPSSLLNAGGFSVDGFQMNYPFYRYLPGCSRAFKRLPSSAMHPDESEAVNWKLLGGGGGGKDEADTVDFLSLCNRAGVGQLC